MDLKLRAWRAYKELGRWARLSRPGSRWGNQLQEFFAGSKKEQFLFFSPHQDDEVISLGVPIAELVVRGCHERVQVTLCSYGAASKVVELLCDGGSCDFHEGTHDGELTPVEFGQARDLEFIASCQALGVPDKNIHLPKRRSPDGRMTVEEARTLITDQLAATPDAVVCMIGPSYDGFDKSVQHPDHRALGQAGLDLYNEGKISKLFLFMEPSGIRNFRVNASGVRMTRMKASPAAGRRIEDAVEQYRLWDPAQGRYAVGEHSVKTLIENIRTEQTSYFWMPARDL
mgnify:CR=1 FL=1